MKHFIKVGTAIACAFAATTAIAQDGPTPEEQAAASVENRQAVFKLLSFNMGPLGGMLRGNVEFDATLVETNATHIADLGEMIPALFAADTTGVDGLDTKALDSIWGNMAGFEEKAEALVMAANAAAEAAAGGDRGATMQAVGGIGQACGSCHDDFRAD